MGVLVVLRFVEQYGSYVINYNLGKDLVGDFIRRRVGNATDVEETWHEFERLMSSPRLPASLVAR